MPQMYLSPELSCFLKPRTGSPPILRTLVSHILESRETSDYRIALQLQVSEEGLLPSCLLQKLSEVEEQAVSTALVDQGLHW